MNYSAAKIPKRPKMRINRDGHRSNGGVSKHYQFEMILIRHA